MRQFSIFLVSILFVSCLSNNPGVSELEKRIDSLNQKIEEGYKPGFGEFMSNIQVHHAKLWFAGQNQNWQLADFEIHEILESIDAISQYETDRKESKEVIMIKPSIDSVLKSIQAGDKISFDKNYKALTETCNECHRTVGFEFNRVKIPDHPPFDNQDFSK